MRVTQANPLTQQASLRKLAEMTARAIIDPIVQETAKAITADVDARDDEGELQAIFDAVKHGTSRVSALKNGVRYVADPKISDYFIAPKRMLEQCDRGACAGDCDDHTMLVAALAGSIGFDVGLRVWGPVGRDFEHVYAVARLPKRRNGEMQRDVGMDTTVPASTLGWEPPRGHVLTAWLEEEG